MIHRFSDNRENATVSILKKAKSSGVIQKVNGSWRIVSIKKKKLWTPKYKTKSKAQAALRGYQANK